MPADPLEVQRIYLLAVEQTDPGACANLLDRECGNDLALRQAVEDLLRGQQQAGATAEFPGGDPEATRVVGARREEPSLSPSGDATERLFAGRYRLKEKLGEGGMGQVWVAEQTEPVQRIVALKLIKTGLATPELQARFKQERQTLALMDHPSIARVFDAGVGERGEPYLVMEFIQGVPLKQFADDTKLTLRQRLELLIPICQAVQHAHQKGIIHRDLKPANILVTLVDGKPVPKVIDFGVAKVTGPALFGQAGQTDAGSIIGTLEYMSPEQADPHNEDIDTRSDIYALGVILYELLTGDLPFGRQQLYSGSLLRALQRIKEEEPARPSSRVAQLRGELDWIVLKCLEKDRTRRYSTAEELAQELRRYLADEPVQAGPPSGWYRAWKFLKRNRGRVLAATLLLLTLVGGIIGTTWGLLKANQARRFAEEKADEARRAATVAADAKTLAEKRLSQAEKSNGILRSIFANLDPGMEQGGGRPLRAILGDELDRAAKELQGDSVGDPLAVAQLQAWVGGAQLGLGNPSRAIPLLTEARATYERLKGPDDLNTLRLLSNLAVAYNAVHKPDLALALHEEVLKRRQATLGPTHTDTLVSLNNVGDTLRVLGKYGRAILLLEEARTRQQEVFAAEDTRILATMNNLGLALLEDGKLDRAIPLLEQTRERRRQTVGPGHIDTIRTTINLVAAYAASRKLEQARPLCEEALAQSRKNLGPDHPLTLLAMNHLAACYGSAKQLDRALPLLEEVLRIQRVQLGPDNLATLETLKNMALACTAAGQHDKAVPLLEERRAGLARTLGPDHAKVVAATGDLVTALLAAKQGAQAMPLAREYLEGLKRQHGAESEVLEQARIRLGNDLTRQGRSGDAEPIFREVLALQEKKDPDDWKVFTSRSRLANALIGQKKFDEAENLLLNAVEGLKAREAKIPPGHTALLDTLQRLVALYEAQGKKDEAAKWRQEIERRKANRPGAN
jgi:tetratricopeptide (TPR) repeat protein